MRISDWSSDVCATFYPCVFLTYKLRQACSSFTIFATEPQHLLGAPQRRLVIGNLDILARGGQPLDRGAQQRHLAMHRRQPILDPRERQRRIVSVAKTIILFPHRRLRPSIFDNFSQHPTKSNDKAARDPKVSIATLLRLTGLPVVGLAGHFSGRPITG